MVIDVAARNLHVFERHTFALWLEDHCGRDDRVHVNRCFLLLNDVEFFSELHRQLQKIEWLVHHRRLSLVELINVVFQVDRVGILDEDFAQTAFLHGPDIPHCFKEALLRVKLALKNFIR